MAITNILLRLEEKDKETLTRLARARGLATCAYLRMKIKEIIYQEKGYDSKGEDG